MIKPKYEVDTNWLQRISYKLNLFGPINSTTWKSRCHICGDSQKRKSLCRLFFYTKKGQLMVNCKNCGFHKSFYNYMKEHHSSDFSQYKKNTMLESFNRGSLLDLKKDIGVDTNKSKKTDTSRFVLDINNISKYTMPVVDNEEARSYLESRGFSTNELKRLRYVPDFVEFAKTYTGDEHALAKMKPHPRIIIPFINTDGVVEALQGRSLQKDDPIKYITLKAHSDVSKIFGMYELDNSKTSYCVEGPFDSFFVDNCIATCDANLTKADADVYIWDAQPRNPDVIKYMKTAIENGKSVVIWPFSTDDKIDINDMINRGLSRERLMSIIKENTYSGAKAYAKFSKWSKI